MKLDEPFECRQCAACCSELSLDAVNNELFPAFFNSAFMLHCCKPGLTVFDWEAKEMFHEAEKRGIKLSIVPYKIVYDLNKNSTIIMQYSITDKKCQFLFNSRCMIYDKRPIICRLFPPNVRGLTGGTMTISCTACPNDMTEKDWAEATSLGLSSEELIKKVHRRYGEIFEAEVEYEIMSKQTNDWINLLVMKGMIKPAMNYEPKALLQKAASSPIYSLSMFLKAAFKDKAKDIDAVIENSAKLGHAKAFLRDLEKQ
ncbi:MAG TPA: YkgJ family cysteine cluster protein [Nanoarchaeota archaeon]|nr:YkgJ family cysteine cluster protein [Nanoarchaeota archaeon]